MYILHTNNIFALMGVLVAYNKVDYLYGFAYIVRILAPLTDKTNISNNSGRTQMYADIARWFDGKTKKIIYIIACT